MFPALPSQTTPELDQLVLDVMTASAALGKGIHPLILEEVARLMAKVNSYYTNAMEGNPSQLRDIEAALNRRLAKPEAARNFQLEHVAHIQVQKDMVARLRAEPGLRICSEEFLRWLHEQFYLKLPPEMRFAKTEGGRLEPVEPGRLRDRGVTVGAHAAPERREDVVSRLRQFEESLSPERLTGSRKVLGMAASHHRLLWIHPFSDGNGRVARLFTIAYGIRIGVGDSLLWTATRAFARNRRDYDAHLAAADLPRRNDLDGRGPLSEENLTKFCAFFLECCLDQIRYMADRLKLEELERRYRRYCAVLAKEKAASKAGLKVMEKLFLQGQVGRSEVLDICRVKRRRATQVIRELLYRRFVHSETAYGALRLNISADMAAVLFPELT
jgi:Fic family protein